MESVKNQQIQQTVAVQGAPKSSHAAKAEASALLRPDPGLVIWTWFIFFGLLLFFRKFGLGPLITSMEEREKLISDAVYGAKKTQKELAKINATRDNILVDAKEEMESLIREGRKKAEETAQGIIETAKENGERMVQEAKKEIEGERRAAVLQMKEELVDLSLLAASKLAERELADENNKKYVENIVTELSA